MSMYRRFLPYGVAISSTAIAFLLSLLAQLVLPRTVGAFFYISIAVTAWYGGIKPGVVAISLAVLALNYYFMPPVHPGEPFNLETSLWLILFVVVSLIISLLSSNLRQSTQNIKRLNQQLADESAERLKTALNAAQMGLWDWNIVTGEINGSPEYEYLLGLARGSFDGRYDTFVACIHPDDRAALHQVISDSLHHRVPFHHEFRVVWADSSIHWLEGRGQAFYTEARQPMRLSGTIMAIDQRKQAEAALQESETRFRALVDAMFEGIVMQENGTIIEANPGFASMFGYSLDEVLNKSAADFLTPDSLERSLRHLENPYELPYEITGIKQDGSPIHLEVVEKQTLNQGRTVTVSAVRDITERKQAQMALQQLNAELEQRVLERTADLTEVNERLLQALMEQQRAKQDVEDLYNNAPCGYHSLDANGVIIRINDTELNWLGCTRDQVLNQTKFVDYLTPDSQQTFRQNFPQFIQRGWVNDLEFQIRYKDGSTRWVTVNGIAIKDAAGNFVMSRSSLFDITDRKQAEQTLALQAVITRNMAEGICLVKADDATIVYANPKFEQMFGYDLGELTGQHVSVVNYASGSVTAEDVNQSIRAAVLQNREATYEVHNVKKDGTPFWCSATCSVFKHPEHGDVLVAVHQDISDRRRAEAALQRQTRQKQLLWTITQVIRQSLDLDAILNAAVTEARQLLAVDRSAIYRFNSDWSGDFIVESVAAQWVKVVEPDVCQIWEDTYLQETQGGRFQNHETLVVADIYTADLQPCHVELLEQFQARAYAIAPIFVGESLWGLLALYHNAAPHHWEFWEIELLEQIAAQLAIAIQQAELYSQLQIELQERKQAEAVIREAERRWRSLLNNVQLIVVGLDQSGRINYVNPFFLNLTGFTGSEVLGKNWFENFLPPSDQQFVQTVFSHVLHNNAYPYYQNSILTKAGEERFIAWNNTMLQDLDGNVVGTISIGEDITERRKVEELKNEFIGIVSHELRTPLTSIQMSLGLLKSGIYAKKPDKMQRMIEIALLDTNRLVNLVNDILDLERLESGQTVLEKTTCQASELMQQAVNGVQAIAAQQNITLTIAPTDAVVWAAPDTIIQTLTNLVSNAIKFSPAHSVITLQAEGQTDHVLFQVIDHGRGIPDDMLETIFGRFQQVDASDSREKGGTGLGLPICRSIIERHSGKIWAESQVGTGSTFFFTLPLPPEHTV